MKASGYALALLLALFITGVPYAIRVNCSTLGPHWAKAVFILSGWKVKWLSPPPLPTTSQILQAKMLDVYFTGFQASHSRLPMEAGQ
jgi:hypothetical protein